VEDEENPMNERIRELVRQAGLDDADFPIENWDNVPLAKFAELIVQKCADIGQQYADGNYEVYNQILKHFGVEE
jgi:hypothetical protein